MNKKKKSGRTPPCPGNPEDYTWVNSREGGHWRRNRGSVKPARLNTSFKNNVKLNKIVSPIASTIKKRLMPFLEGLETGRFVANVSGLLRKEYYKSGKLDFLGLIDYDIQPYHKLQKLLRYAYTVEVKNNEVIIEIPVGEGTVPKGNSQMTGYIYEGILMYGDVTKPKSLRTDSETSPIYEFRLKTNTTCRLSLILPSGKVSWMVMLKLSCVYGKERADYKKYHGMKVVWAETA
jgi:hypothetical protein